jgi:hypothetical protein
MPHDRMCLSKEFNQSYNNNKILTHSTKNTFLQKLCKSEMKSLLKLINYYYY